MIDNVEQSPNRNNNGSLTRKEDNITHMLTELLKLIYWFILAGLYELIYSNHDVEYFFLVSSIILNVVANIFHIYNRNTYHILYFAIALVSLIYIEGEINANQKLLRCKVFKCDLKKILLRRSLYAKCAVYST